MKYCINYKKDFMYYDKVDEVIFKYEEDFFNSLKDFLKENPVFQNKTLIYSYVQCGSSFSEIEKELIDAMNIIEDIKKSYPSLDFKIEFRAIDVREKDTNIFSILNEKDISYFFHYFVNSWDEFVGILERNVSDVYIVDHLCFSIKKISSIAHDKNVQIKVFPNVAQGTWSNSHPLKKFFIRPEDTVHYEGYVDVCVFWEVYDKLNTIFKIYVIDKEWKDELGFIIQDFNYPLNGNYLPNFFAAGRLNCGKKCVEGSGCTYCTQCLDIYKMLEDNEVEASYIDNLKN